MRNIKTKTNGFSLVEVMIALGLLSVVGVGTMSYFSKGLNLSRHLEQKAKIRNQLDEASLYWTKGENCKKDLIDSGVLKSLKLSGADISQSQSIDSIVFDQKPLKVNTKNKDLSLVLKKIDVGTFKDISPKSKAHSLYSSKISFSYAKDDGFAFQKVEMPVVFETVSAGGVLQLVGCSSSQKDQYSVGDIAQLCVKMGEDYYFDGKDCQNSRITAIELEINNLRRSVANISSSTPRDVVDSPSCWKSNCLVRVQFAGKKPGAQVMANSTKCIPADAGCTNNSLIGTVSADGTFAYNGTWDCISHGQGSGADQTWYVDGVPVGSHSWRCGM